jgi:hypothetical protein
MSITKGECLKHIRELTRENNSLKQKNKWFREKWSEACEVAIHFYREAVSEGPQESDKEWLEKNPWLEPSEGQKGG